MVMRGRTRLRRTWRPFFEKAPDGYFDTKAGMRLRKEIYEVGDSRDVNVSIEKFLGRPALAGAIPEEAWN